MAAEEAAARVERALSSVSNVDCSALTLREIGGAVIRSNSPDFKAAWTVAAYKHFFLGADTQEVLHLGACVAIGEGDRPQVEGLTLVHPSKMPNIGKGGSVKSQAMMLHALVHVELAAVDLSWDIIVRDWGAAAAELLPSQFYLDWLQVAFEECKHYLVLRARLRELVDDRTVGHAPTTYDYGSFPCHDGIWNDALKTAGSLLDRLVLEHCTHEARGIDVCFLTTIPRFRRGGDEASADLLELVVLADEVDHVRKGLKYYKQVYESGREFPDSQECSEEEFVRSFRETQERVYGGGHARGPFASDLRRQAGFTAAYYC